MRKLAIIMALASTALATPAVARDKSWYVGVEGGALLVEDTHLNYDQASPVLHIDDAVVINHKTGIDADILAGYDFGMVRLEAEAGYKRASLGDGLFDVRLLPGAPLVHQYNLDGRVRVYSAMVNALLDFGSDDGWNGYVGPGIGEANVRYSADAAVGAGTVSVRASDSRIAWQVIAGVHTRRQSSVLFGARASAPHGIEWLHLHETWLPQA